MITLHYVHMSQVSVKVCNDKQSILLFNTINSFILDQQNIGEGKSEICYNGRFQNMLYS